MIGSHSDDMCKEFKAHWRARGKKGKRTMRLVIPPTGVQLYLWSHCSKEHFGSSFFGCLPLEGRDTRGLHGVSLLAPVFLGWQAPKGFTCDPDFDFGVIASRENPFEKMCSEKPKQWHSHDMAMSEHAFLRAKTFHN